MKAKYNTKLKEWLLSIADEGSIVDLGFTQVYMAGANSIDAYQNGYAGDDWKSSWIVFAKWGGSDAFIYDSVTEEILVAMHGMGKWDAHAISPSFEKFDFILSTWQKVAKPYNSILDDECELRTDFISELKEALEKHLESKYVEAFLGFIAF